MRLILRGLEERYRNHYWNRLGLLRANKESDKPKISIVKIITPNIDVFYPILYSSLKLALSIS